MQLVPDSSEQPYCATQGLSKPLVLNQSPHCSNGRQLVLPLTAGFLPISLMHPNTIYKILYAEHALSQKLGECSNWGCTASGSM